ncbi:Helix-hairpin-helix domain-containing protein [Giardia muris]|uniref:Helix-hairpin-helix domain-containing protein n=1 Tax=Giardia muris TaxID=5742 RepID=A0A4Z1SVQ0_GIAMU|nr:Helix-hairpin-helix domain-containing protein [Giardia muris]|eukprot:TNJ29932.1 Helix-hairpin-helix domain-containing protein [Giardia muris]
MPPSPSLGDILVSDRERNSPILPLLRAPYRFVVLTPDYVPVPDLAIFLAQTRTAAVSAHSLENRLLTATYPRRLVVVHVEPATADMLVLLSDIAAAHGASVFPYWQHADLAHLLDESRRFTRNPMAVLETTPQHRRSDTAGTVLALLQAARLNKAKIRSICHHFKSLRELLQAGPEQLAKIPEFTLESAQRFFQYVGGSVDTDLSTEDSSDNSQL